MFDIKKLQFEHQKNTRYERRINQLTNNKIYVEGIKHTVEDATDNLNNKARSFVIYGEPQSGKTEMMIALTARVLDLGFKIVVVLLNDSVQLLNQNLDRFTKSGLDPSPKNFNEILDSSVQIGSNEWVIFCKKNTMDLNKLINKIGGYDKKVIIDDEADYATPNSKVNTDEKTRINELTEKLIGSDGIYIGVTATPARLDLNNTHNNQNEKWVDFPPHPLYKGQNEFFPTPIDTVDYNLSLLPDEGDDPKYLREALFSFLTNVAYLNTKINEHEDYYSMLIHTSGRKADHTEDYKQVVKIFEALKEPKNNNHEKYYRRIHEIAAERYPGEEDEIIKYIFETKSRSTIVVMNSDKERNLSSNISATSPATPLTIVIGGNIVSRGVTFTNLLSMFFTRDVKHKIHQDTYIQRARMFGDRGSYLEFFELTIPKKLFFDWHKCFIFHRLSLEARRSGNGSPVWLEDHRIAAVSSRSIDKTTIAIDRGEMSFEIFDYKDSIENIINSSKPNFEKLLQIQQVLGKDKLPDYLLDYIKHFNPDGDPSIAIHHSASMTGYQDADQKQIKRAKGFIGKWEREEQKFPNAIHHFKIFTNNENKARVFYRYKGNVKFLKNIKKHDKRVRIFPWSSSN